MADLLPISDSPFNDYGMFAPNPNYAEVDEASPDDADYVYGPSGNPSGVFQSFAVKLSPGTDPGDDTGHVLKFRLGYQNAGPPNDASLYVDVLLYQGDPLGSGTYITDSVGGINGSSALFPAPDGDSAFATYTLTLDSTEAAQITDYTDLWIMVTTQNYSTEGGAWNRFVRFSWLALTIPDAGGPTLDLDPDYTVGGVVIGGDGNVHTSSHVTMDPTTDTPAIGGVVLAGRTQFQFLSASVPSTQLGNQWRLDSFFFRYSAEEET
jgi:hypothetical protein